MFCERCGSLVETGNTFCTTCGTPIPVEELPTPKKPVSPRPVRRTPPPKPGGFWNKLDEPAVKHTVLVAGGAIGIGAILVFLLGFAL